MTWLDEGWEMSNAEWKEDLWWSRDAVLEHAMFSGSPTTTPVAQSLKYYVYRKVDKDKEELLAKFLYADHAQEYLNSLNLPFGKGRIVML